MKTNIVGFIVIMSLLIPFLSGCDTNSRKELHGYIPIIDVSEKYPAKTFSIQDIADIEYVPLETTDDVLLDGISGIVHLSNERIIMANYNLGDVFVFDRQGKNLSYFNHKGQSGTEYAYISRIVYDEQNKEVYVYSREKFLVFSENGTYKRTLQTIPDTNFDLYNFDDKTLLAYDKYGTEVSSDKSYRTKPYLFLSKQDGGIVSALDWELPVRYSNMLNFKVNWDGKELTATKTITLEGDNLYDGKDFVIADLSSDTIFQITQDKKRHPLLICEPSVHKSKNIFLTPLLKGDKFIFLSKCVVDFDDPVKEDVEYKLFYDFITGKIYTASIVNSDIPVRIGFGNIAYGNTSFTEKNMAAALIESGKIVEFMQERKVSGALLPIAENSDADDNPVVMIMKFK
jgi:hypothetical protein